MWISPSGRKPTSRIAQHPVALRLAEPLRASPGAPATAARLFTSSGSVCRSYSSSGGCGSQKASWAAFSLPLVVEPLPDARRRRLEHVGDVLAVDQVRHVIAEVDVAGRRYAADQVVALVHPAAEAVDERLRRRLVLARGRRGPASSRAA